MFLFIQSQGKTVAELVILGIINILPLLNCLLPLSKVQRRAILITVVCLDAILIAYATWLTRQHIYNIGYDTWMHLAIIQRGLEKGLFPGDPYYLGFPTTPHYSIVDLFYTLLSAISGIPPHRLWGTLSFIFAALIFLTSVWWWRGLFEDPILGWLAGLLFMLSITIKWHYATYPRNIALIFFAINHLFYFLALRTRHDKFILYSGVALGFCIMSHLFTGLMCLLSLTMYVLMQWLIDAIHRRPRAWTYVFDKKIACIPIGLFVASPWLIVFGKQALTHSEISIAHYSLPGETAQASIVGWTFTRYKPLLFWQAFPLLMWVLAGIGLLVCFYHIVRGNYRPLHIFLISSAILPPAILLTPFYSPVVNIIGAWMVSRFIRLMPVPAMAALGVYVILRLLSAEQAPRRFYRVIGRSIGVLLALIIMVILITPTITKQKELYKTRNDILAPLFLWDADFDKLRDRFKGKVVLSDPWTSYFLTYYTSAYVAAIPAAHGSPYINHEARLADVSTIFDSGTDPKKRSELLALYNVEYILLNLRPKFDGNASRYGLIGDYYPPNVREVFDLQKGFELVYNINGVFVYVRSFLKSSGGT